MNGTSFTAILGIVFLVLGFASVFLMFHLWGYPFDKATRTSAAPKWAMVLHRAIGFAYAIVYVIMMFKMVPRLFTYQVEFPARTVVHIIMALAIGLILILKISIVRFFRHLEEWMPYLGTGLLFCTVILLGLSLPFSFKDRLLSKKVAGGDVFGPASIERVKKVLPLAELPKEADREARDRRGAEARASGHADSVRGMSRSEDHSLEATVPSGLGAHGGANG